MAEVLAQREIRKMIKSLLADIEEEDIAISLFNTYFQNKEELLFFDDKNRDRVLNTLKKLSDDGLRHREILGKIISLLSARCESRGELRGDGVGDGK